MLKKFLLACSLLGLPAMAATPLETMRKRDLASAMRVLGEWWPGLYDNHEQIVRQSGHGLSLLADKPFQRVNISVKKLTDNTLGQNGFLVTSSLGNENPSASPAQIMVANPDIAENAIRLKRYRQTAGAPAYIGADCDLLLRFEGGQFVGSVATRQCQTDKGLSDYQLIIGPRYVWERDQARNARTGKIAWEMAPGSGFDWHQATRARPVTCNVFGDEKGAMLNTRFLKTIHLHDQGGKAEIAWPDGRTLVFTIHNRAFTAIPDREYPIFRIHEKGNPIPIAYAYSVDDTNRFGLNLGWFYIRCYDDRDISPQDMLETKS